MVLPGPSTGSVTDEEKAAQIRRVVVEMLGDLGVGRAAKDGVLSLLDFGHRGRLRLCLILSLGMNQCAALQVLRALLCSALR